MASNSAASNPKAEQQRVKAETKSRERMVKETVSRLPKGTKSSKAADGGVLARSKDGRQWEVGQAGQVTHFTKPGTDARFAANGRLTSMRVASADRSQMVISRGAFGPRRVDVVRPDGVRIVTVGSRMGYVQRPLSRSGFVSRTYVVGGQRSVQVYSAYNYRGAVYYQYVPGFYYQQSMYSWASDPWSRPVAYGWGWRGSPWATYYGGYFSPSPVYANASMWLADYVLAENLRQSYDDRQQFAERGPNDQSGGPVEISMETKQLIAEEVKAQIEEDRAQAARSVAAPAPNSDSLFPSPAAPVDPPVVNTPPPALDPRKRTFIVSENLEIMGKDGKTCALTPGDFLSRIGTTPTSDNKIPVRVLNSKLGDCPAETESLLEVATLQEMYNQFQAKINTGIRELAQEQGKNGIPAGPAPIEQSSGLKNGVSADSDIESLILRQSSEADKAEADLRNSVASRP